MIRNPVSGQWYSIPEYSKYEVNPEGEIRRRYKSGFRIIRPIFKDNHKGSAYYVVHIARDDGEYKQIKISDIVWKVFRGEKKNKSVHHRNGIISDNDIGNLELISRERLGRMTGGNAGRKTVVRIREDGETICWYKSAREAAKDVNMSYQTVMDRCNGKVKKEFALDGTTFRWLDEEKKVEKFCRMLKEAAVRKLGDARPEAEWEW